MKTRNDLTAEYVQECFDYDCKNGMLIWRERPVSHFKRLSEWKRCNARYARTEAGTNWKSGRNTYRKIRVNGLEYLAHRLAWLAYYGKWPDGELDHIDGNGLNNAINNLRDVTPTLNRRNTKMYSHNSSGINGVYWSKNDYRWVANISLNGRTHYLGSFKTIEEASMARKTAQKECSFTDRHGLPSVKTTQHRKKEVK